MAVWTTPITWTNGAVSAATMNTEVRDHLNWLKSGLDLVTNSTAADSGTATYLQITRPNAADTALAAKVTGDANQRIVIRAAGGIEMGDGTTAPNLMVSLNNGALQHDRFATMSYPLKLYVKAGALNDTDIPAHFTGSASGSIGVDTSTGTGRLYVRVGSTWRYVALV